MCVRTSQSKSIILFVNQYKENEMKKLPLAIVLSGFVGAYALGADVVIQHSELPQKAQQFIKSNFAKNAILLAEKSFDEYDVKLADEVEVEFTQDGEWRAVKSYRPLANVGFVPKKVLDTVKSKYPQASVMKVEKEWKSYEIGLDNHKKLIIDENGTLIAEKM